MKTNELTKSRNNFGGVHYTTAHTAKMNGVASLSTDINSNKICQLRRKNGASICALCFSSRMWDDQTGRYRTNNAAFKRNTEILCNRLLDAAEIPYIDPARWPLFRFEAYADIQSVTQVLNYFKIARLNPGVKFALWTKNPGFVARALRIVPKPENLQIVLSSLAVNHPARAAWPFIDKVFTVYSDASRANINCGARSCMSCRRCYEKNPAGVDVLQVSELVK